MDAGELVRLHGDVTLASPFLIPQRGKRFSPRVRRGVYVPNVSREPVTAHMHLPRSPGLNLAVSYYISLSVIIRKLLPVLRKTSKFTQAFSRVRERRSAALHRRLYSSIPQRVGFVLDFL